MEEKKIVRRDIAKYKSIEALGNIEGGKHLKEALERSVVGSFEAVIAGCRTLPEIELRVLIVKMASDYSLLKVMTRAGRNKKYAQAELTRLLSEDPELEEEKESE